MLAPHLAAPADCRGSACRRSVHAVIRRRAPDGAGRSLGAWPFPRSWSPSTRSTRTSARAPRGTRSSPASASSAQRRLAAAHVAVVGAGGLGSPVVLALAAAGVGTLTVIDDDVVEASNLQRQVMHRIAGCRRAEGRLRRAGRRRPVAADRRAPGAGMALAPTTPASCSPARTSSIDGTDTFETREVVASACEDLGVPLVWGVVQEFHAQVTVFWSASARRARRRCGWPISTRPTAWATCRPASRSACSARSACRSGRSSRPRPSSSHRHRRAAPRPGARDRRAARPHRRGAAAPERGRGARPDARRVRSSTSTPSRRSPPRPPARRCSTCASRTRPRTA